MQKIGTIAISTGGGDAPGLNAVIRAAALAALSRDWRVLGIRRGYRGLFPPRDVLVLDRDSVRGISHLGGSILGTDSRGSPFERIEEDADGEKRTVDLTPTVLEGLSELAVDALISVGGDGSMKLAYHLVRHGVKVVGVPKTIDNDLEGTAYTFGFDTAVAVATEAIGRLHSTAEAHDRVFVVEVMGRYAGWIALHSGIAGGADVILLPELPFTLESVCEKILRRERAGRRFSIVVAAEGARPVGGELSVREAAEGGRQERLGGIAERLVPEIERCTGKEARSLVLGHLQRGGRPTARDRLLAQRFGAAAVRTIEAGDFGTMVSLDPPQVLTVPLEQTIARMKLVPLDGDTVATARDIGICLGD